MLRNYSTIVERDCNLCELLFVVVSSIAALGSWNVLYYTKIKSDIQICANFLLIVVSLIAVPDSCWKFLQIV
jgi:hypothetical protein